MSSIYFLAVLVGLPLWHFCQKKLLTSAALMRIIAEQKQ